MERSKLYQAVAASRSIHIPIPIDETETAEYRLKQKEVLKSRVLSDCNTLEHWRPISYPLGANIGTNYSVDDNSLGLTTLELSDKIVHSGSHSVFFSCPTNLPQLNDIARGRIYAVPTAYLDIDREDWRDYNRISAWIYAHAPGMKTITIRIQPHNDGDHKVPDVWDREGAHNITLKNDEWNYCVLEFPYLFRDCVNGVGFEYDMVGHEPDAADHVDFYIDDVRLEVVDCDLYEGWVPKKDRIIYSHKGYQPGGRKTAVISDPEITSFKIVETSTGRVVLEKDVDRIETLNGSFGILSFSEITEEGSYMIIAGSLTSRVFRIAPDIWESSIWKDLNFFLVERCGYDVPGKHRCCHGDLLLKHDGKAIVEDGGWHDAADLAQGLSNTIEGTTALLELAAGIDGEEFAALKDRVLEEAKWGMDYVLKMRFGDGYRGNYSSSSIWTDGVIGTGDDIDTEATFSAMMNFLAAWSEALGAVSFASEDPIYAAQCARTAAEDYGFAFGRWDELDKLPTRNYTEYGRGAEDILDANICSVGALAAAALYNITKEDRYCADAHRMARRLLSCQQQTFTDWDVPMVGFFYQDRDKDLIWHHSHHSNEHHPLLALEALCRTFPESEDYMLWYEALAYNGWYYNKLVSFSEPYGIIPAGIYHEDEFKMGDFKLRNVHLAKDRSADFYVAQVKNGIPLGKGWYVRRFPVWYDFRGNNNVSLSEALAANAGSVIRKDSSLTQIAQDQEAFIIGANPFGQSLMVGEGYDFIAHYAVQPGQTTGSLTVGMESLDANDAPFWPQVCTATYKEVWIASATKWAWVMADSFSEGMVHGILKDKGTVFFNGVSNGIRRCTTPDAITGYYSIKLPFGVYEMFQEGGISRTVEVANNTVTRIDGTLYDLSACAEVSGSEAKLKISLKGDAPVKVRIRTASAPSMEQEVEIAPGEECEITGALTDPARLFVALLVPEGNTGDCVEVLDPRMK